MSVITVRGLQKRYQEVHAVRGIDFEIAEGEVLAILGPNGAGKTTTVEILEGHRQRSAGEVSVLGFDPESGGRDLRERIGIVLQSAGIEPELTVKEVLSVYQPMFPRRRDVDEVIGLVGLGEKADSRVKTLSGGQRRRLDLALGLIGDPDVIFLDEPTTGFDPSARRKAWSLVEGLTSLGKTILLTTHYMDEAQQLADRVVVMAQGEIVAEGTPETLGGREQLDTTIEFKRPPDMPALDLANARVEVAADGVSVTTGRPTAVLHALTGWALEHGVELEGLEVKRPSLEDIYLQLTGESSYG